MQLLTHSCTHSLTHSYNYLLTHALTHSLTHSYNYLLTHALTQPYRIKYSLRVTRMHTKEAKVEVTVMVCLKWKLEAAMNKGKNTPRMKRMILMCRSEGLHTFLLIHSFWLGSSYCYMVQMYLTWILISYSLTHSRLLLSLAQSRRLLLSLAQSRRLLLSLAQSRSY